MVSISQRINRTECTQCTSMKRPSSDGVELQYCEKRRTVYDSIFSLLSWCRALGSHYEKEHKKRLALQIIPRKFRLYTQAYLDSRPSEADQLLLDLRGALSYFDANGYQRSAHQRKFHEPAEVPQSTVPPPPPKGDLRFSFHHVFPRRSMIAACIRHIYKDEFSENFVKILAENGWEEARQEVMIWYVLSKYTRPTCCNSLIDTCESQLPKTLREDVGHRCVRVCFSRARIATLTQVPICQVCTLQRTSMSFRSWKSASFHPLAGNRKKCSNLSEPSLSSSQAPRSASPSTIKSGCGSRGVAAPKISARCRRTPVRSAL